MRVCRGSNGFLKHVEAALLGRLDAGLWPDEAQRQGVVIVLAMLLWWSS